MFNLYAKLSEAVADVVEKQEKELNDILRNDREAARVLSYIQKDAGLYKAYLAAKSAHAGQYRWKGRGNVPYVFHLIDVVRIMLKSGITDKHSIIVALLHDTVEDNSLTFKDIKKGFGDQVAKHVNMMTLDDDNKESFYSEKITSEKYAPIRDIKLADRISKLKFIHDFKGGSDKKLSGKLSKKYEKLKAETQRDYSHWYNMGTNKNLSSMYEDYMSRSHSESFF